MKSMEVLFIFWLYEKPVKLNTVLSDFFLQ